MSPAATAPRTAPRATARAAGRTSARPVGTPAGRETRPPLRAVPAPRRAGAPRAPFVILLVALLGGGLLALLLINTALAQGAFVISDLSKSSATLTDQEQALELEVATASAPENLARKASSLGMVPSTNPVFIRLRDGAILGAPAPGVKPTPEPKPSGSSGAAGSAADAAGKPAAASSSTSSSGSGSADHPSLSSGASASTREDAR